MKVVLGAVALAALGWVVAPWVAMARRGTLDQQTVESWREPQVPRPRRAPDDVVVPRPRPAPEPARRRERGTS